MARPCLVGQKTMSRRAETAPSAASSSIGTFCQAEYELRWHAKTVLMPMCDETESTGIHGSRITPVVPNGTPFQERQVVSLLVNIDG